LFNLGAIHSFVTNRLVGKLKKNPCMLKRGFIISILLGKNINIDHVYKGIKVDINGCEMRVDLLPLELYDFEVILGIDWLGMYRAQIDYFAKTLIVQRLEGKRVVFKRERNIIPNCIISIMTTRKMILKRCGAYLAHVIKGKKDDIQLSNIPILREFSEVFLDELSGVPLERKVEVVIDVLPSASPVA